MQYSYQPQMPQASLQVIFDDFESYPFSQDAQFNAGLPDVIRVIKSKKLHALAIDETIARAQWFYFNRIRGLDIPWETYAAYSRDESYSSTSSSSQASGSGRNSNPWAELNTLAEARRMLSPAGEGNDQSMSFGMLSKLIAEGRAGELRGRDIPDHLNTSPPSQSVQAHRPKPWEQQQQQQQQQPQMSSTLSYAAYGHQPQAQTYAYGNYPSQTHTQTLATEYAPSPTFADPFAQYTNQTNYGHDQGQQSQSQNQNQNQNQNQQHGWYGY